MTLYSNLAGITSSTKDPVNFPYGPYLKLGPNTLPTNPYNNSADVACNLAQTDLSAPRAVAAGGAGWQYFPELGIFFPNDADHLGL
jgi:hypothetical protein